MENKKKKDKDNWIRVASKSYLGRFYLFNKATGETRWLPPNVDKKMAPMITKSPPKINFTKATKTPAQDRLKRLQRSMKATQNHSHSSRITRQMLNSKVDNKKEQENYLDDQPSTSSSYKSLTKSPRKGIKRPKCSSLRTEDESKVSKTSTNDDIKKPKLLETTKNSTESTMETGPPSNAKFPAPSNTTEEIQSAEGDNTSTLSSLRTGIVQKIKEICKIPFNTTKKLTQEKSPDRDTKSCSISLPKTHSFKAVKRIKDNQKHFSTSLQDTIMRELRAENDKSDMNTPLSTPKNIKIPTYPRGSANTRLERLKQSLLSQQKQQQQTPTTSANTNTTATTSAQIPILISESGKSYLDTSTTENNEMMMVPSNSIDSSYNTANNTIMNDEIEAMDWQPITRNDETLKNSTNCIDSGFVIEKSKKCLFSIKDANDNQSMGDIYDTVNENLLRYSAEKQNDATSSRDKWKTDYYYFIVDTNVLIKDLTFVDDLTRMKLCDTKGSMLYIPYTVLQELDKLKMRSGLQEGVKTLAIRAIKYLNDKFEHNSFQIKAQSALDERKHLIDVNSPDDSILNCCLQAKKHVKNLLLLTEDVNLRNKAICNNILVSTKSDLVSKRYDIINLNKTL